MSRIKEIEKRLNNIEHKYGQLEYMMNLDRSTKLTIEAMEQSYNHEKEVNELTCNNLKSLAIKQIENKKEELDKKYQEKDKEIERLNNIINELERYINEEYIYDELGMKIFDASKLQDKLQELKGSDK